MDCTPPGSSISGILQARTLEWTAISFPDAGKWKVKVKSLSRVWLLVTPWTAAHQAPPSMGFSRQEYWSGVPLPSPRERLVHTFTYRSKSIHRIDVRATHQGHVVRPVIYSFRVICTMTKSMVELKKWKICNIPWSNFSLSMLWLPHLRK